MINLIKSKCRIEGSCWVWKQGCRNGKYPIFSLGGGKVSDRKKLVRPFIYKFFYKINDPKSIHLTSTCGNPLCCNPEHLYPRKSIKYSTSSTTNRFFEKVNITDTCWLWTGATYKNGYGQFFNGANTRAKGAHMELTHRVSYRMHKGEIPDGMLVLHTCDVRNCVNPDHLFLGTHKDNTQDMINKGRAGFQKHYPSPPVPAATAPLSAADSGLVATTPV